MNLESFFTAQIIQPGQNGQGSIKGSGQAGSTASGLPGSRTFLDLIFALLPQDGGTQTTDSQVPVKTAPPDAGKLPAGDLAGFLALISEARISAEEIAKKIQDLQGAIAAAKPDPDKNKDSLSIFNILLIDSNPENKKSAPGENLSISLNTLLEKLKKENGSDPLLLLFNLTPEQATRLQAQTDGMQDLVETPFGFIQIVPAQNQSNDAAGAVIAAQTLNAGQSAGKMQPLSAPVGDGWNPDGDFTPEQTLKNAPGKAKTGENIQNIAAAAKNAAPLQTAQPGTAPSLPQSWVFQAENGLYAQPGFDRSFGDHFSSAAASLNALTPGSPAGLVTQAQGAAQPHPATQLVAATLQKSAQGGENRNIILQLDPPELGRLQIRLEFGKDKSVKGVLLSEKPETHMMLQRDSHALERALQNAGLDADGSSLSFELARDGDDFGRNPRGGGYDSGGAGAGGDMPELIESAMTWHIDPATGHVRYEFWA